MAYIETSRHDIVNSLVVISRLSQAVQPIVEGMSSYCIENQLVDIASYKQLSIVKDSMQSIQDEAMKLLTIFEQSDSVED